MLVIDFNPVVYSELRRRGVACVYGDTANMETLHHAQINQAELVVCSIPDHILKGTDNERLLRKVRQLCPSARALVTADGAAGALRLYELGADFVFIPHIHSSARIARVIEAALRGGLDEERAEEVGRLKARNEVLA